MTAHILDVDEEKLVRHFCLDEERKQVLDWFEGQGFSRPDDFHGRVKLANKLRELGNKRYQASDFNSAMMHALGAMHCIDFSQARAALQGEPEKGEVLKALVPILSNLAMIFLKRGDAYNAIRAGDLGIDRASRWEQLATDKPEVERHRAKLLFRRGLAKGERKEFVDARADLREAAKLMPNDREIRKALENCKAGAVQQRGADDDKWRGLMTDAPRWMRFRAKLHRCWRFTSTATTEFVACCRQPEGMKTCFLLMLGPLLTFGLRYMANSWAERREEGGRPVELADSAAPPHATEL